MKMKCYIDVNFTIEEDLSNLTDEEKAKHIDNKEFLVTIFKQDLLERLEYFSHNIKDLGVVVTFEEGK